MNEWVSEWVCTTLITMMMQKRDEIVQWWWFIVEWFTKKTHYVISKSRVFNQSVIRYWIVQTWKRGLPQEVNERMNESNKKKPILSDRLTTSVEHLVINFEIWFDFFTQFGTQGLIYRQWTGWGGITTPSKRRLWCGNGSSQIVSYRIFANNDNLDCKVQIITIASIAHTHIKFVGDDILYKYDYFSKCRYYIVLPYITRLFKTEVDMMKWH